MSIDELLLSGISFGRTLVGIATRPYETYRRIVDRGKPGELLYIALLLSVYFALVAGVRTAAFRPFLLTKQFIVLGSAALATYILVVSLLWSVGNWVGGRGSLVGLMLAWAYTLVPTICWFFATSILYVFFPPPRTASIQGMAFSILYLVFTVTLFFWKGMLGYLTLRFGLRLDLGKILLVTAVCVPIVTLYSVWMYRMGIFRVPFV